ncbi:bestrophin family protein [Chitinophaga rhizosphaerae]|uniref:bestrophin family protein n=1 Tax=Chitinophaga rhizosphaerae TaxID=1864947 RepID=UPI000F7FD2A5|nr:bestrophin family ion channel [Chitinophaga rhizosphaerae]
MINYNPTDWFTFIFRIHRADTVKKLFPMFIAIALYSCVIAWLELTFIRVQAERDHLKNISAMHGLLGFVISMLLVFRTNTAYDRWWEGRRQWGGLVNSSRNLAMKLKAMLPTGHPAVAWFAHMVPNYAFALKDHLRGEFHPDKLENIPEAELERLGKGIHVPNRMATLILEKINELHRQQVISGDQLITINAQLESFTDICGACERIKNTPIPFSYSVFLKKFIFFYVMTLPMGYVFGLGYLVVPMVVFIFYVLASLELIAEEIEDPFGKDANDLPTETISANIRRHVQEIMQ